MSNPPAQWDGDVTAGGTRRRRDSQRGLPRVRRVDGWKRATLIAGTFVAVIAAIAAVTSFEWPPWETRGGADKAHTELREEFKAEMKALRDELPKQVAKAVVKQIKDPEEE